MKRAVVVIIGGLLSVFLLAWLVSRVDWNEFASTVPEGFLVPLALSGLLYIGTLVIRAIRLWWLAPRVTKTAIDAFGAFMLICVNNILNHLLPLRAGEVAFLSLAKKEYGLALTQSALLLFVSRLGDLAGLLLIISVAIWFLPGLQHLAYAVIVLTALCLISLYRVDVIVRVARAMLTRLAPIMPAFLKKRALGITDKLSDAKDILHDKTLFTGNILCSVAIWLCNSLFFFIVMQQLGILCSVPQVVVGGAGAAILPSLPLNAFGTFGTLEAGWTGGLMLVGVGQQDASASGIVLHGVIIVVSALVTIPAAFRFWLTPKR